jgi:hypothetical protein
MVQAITNSGTLPDDETAKRNRKFNKEEVEQELNEIFPEFDETAKNKVSEIFFEAVERRINEDESFKAAVGQLLFGDAVNPFWPDADLNLIEILANKIAELEESIATVEAEADEIAQDLISHDASLKEERLIEAAARSSKPMKQSTVELYLEEASEDNAEAYYNLEDKNKGLDLVMRRYVESLDRTGGSRA